MNSFDIPIFKKSYDLYKTFQDYHRLIPKKDRFTTYERAENTLLDIIEGVFRAGVQSKSEKIKTLGEVSIKLNLFRVFIRLMKDVKSLDNKKYIFIQSEVDEIGRMLGGWMRFQSDSEKEKGSR
jgi:hypothetical protein